MGISDPMFAGDLQRRLAEVERQLRDLTSGRRLEDASVGARGIVVRGGGSITIDGGDLKLIDENGVEVVNFGTVSFNGEEGSRGWLFKFDSGDVAFSLGGTPGDQFWGLWDENNNYLVTNDAISGYGLGRPYLGYRMVPSADAQIAGTSHWPTHTNTSFTKLMQGINPVWHPKVSVGVLTNVAGGGTAHWRLLINGEDVTGDISGTAVRTVDVPGWGTDITPGQAVGFDIEAYISGGTRVYIQCDRLYGVQS